MATNDKPEADQAGKKKPIDQQPKKKKASEDKKLTEKPLEPKQPTAKSPEVKKPNGDGTAVISDDKIKQILRSPKPKARDDIIFARRDLEPHSKEELIEIILRMQTMVPKPQTDQVGMGNIAAITFKISSASVEHISLPIGERTETEDKPAVNWLVKLICSDEKYRPLGLDIHNDVIVGRMTRESMPDLDLTLYRGTVLGVSRRHAMIRPTKKALYLTDLNSTNGTYLNGSRLDPGVSQALKEGDTISFAQIHFKLTIDQPPGNTA
jgi:hypothetical protein